MNELTITNAHLVDGTGAPARLADIAISDGVITEVGHIDQPGGEVIDAAGHLVTPGFVDIHTHFDGQVCWDKEVTPSCWHGVTTIVMGNCGVGFAPVRPGTENDLVTKDSPGDGRPTASTSMPSTPPTASISARRCPMWRSGTT